MIRLGIVDDHPAIHAALVARCADDTDLQVVATARDAAEGQALLARHDLDVIVLDLDLGDGPGGIALLGACRPDGPPVVVLSALAFPSLVRAAQERGAAGYVPKDADLSGLVAAIRTAAAGGTWFAPAAMRAARRAPRAPSAREVELLVLLLDGASNDEVAAGLDLSVKTVESHLRRLFGRYGVLSRTELVVLALREGWVRLGGTPGDAFVDIPTERPTSRS